MLPLPLLLTPNRPAEPWGPPCHQQAALLRGCRRRRCTKVCRVSAGHSLNAGSTHRLLSLTQLAVTHDPDAPSCPFPAPVFWLLPGPRLHCRPTQQRNARPAPPPPSVLPVPHVWCLPGPSPCCRCCSGAPTGVCHDTAWSPSLAGRHRVRCIGCMQLVRQTCDGSGDASAAAVLCRHFRTPCHGLLGDHSRASHCSSPPELPHGLIGWRPSAPAASAAQSPDLQAQLQQSPCCGRCHLMQLPAQALSFC